MQEHLTPLVAHDVEQLAEAAAKRIAAIVTARYGEAGPAAAAYFVEELSERLDRQLGQRLREANLGRHVGV